MRYPNLAFHGVELVRRIQHTASLYVRLATQEPKSTEVPPAVVLLPDCSRFRGKPEVAGYADRALLKMLITFSTENRSKGHKCPRMSVRSRFRD